MTVSSLTDLDHCNAALARIGESRINSIEEPETDTESICADLYKITVNSILSRYDWKFAKRPVQLASDADVPVAERFTYLYAYKLPSSMIAGPFAVYANGNFKTSIDDYRHSDDHIFANATRIDVEYRYSPGPQTWPAYVSDLIICALAARFAKPMADNTALAEDLNREAFGSADMNGQGGLYGIAKSIDAKTRPMRSMFERGDPLTATRF